MQKLFSYPIVVDDLPSAPRKYTLKATPKDLVFLAEVLKVPAVKSCQSVIDLRLDRKKHRLDVSGRVAAVLVQESVISLELFDKHYEGDFALFYDTQATYKDIRELDEELGDEIPDLVVDGKIDLGEITIEQVALLIDDYPRREGEVFSFESEFDAETTEQANPYNILKKLKK